MAQAEEDKDKKRRFQLYSVVLEAKDYTEPLAASAKFDKSEYYAHPERYRCTFRDKVLITALLCRFEFPSPPPLFGISCGLL